MIYACTILRLAFIGLAGELMHSFHVPSRTTERPASFNDININSAAGDMEPHRHLVTAQTCELVLDRCAVSGVRTAN